LYRGRAVVGFDHRLSFLWPSSCILTTTWPLSTAALLSYHATVPPNPFCPFPAQEVGLGRPTNALVLQTLSGDAHSKRAKGGPPSPGTLAAREEERKERERRKTEREAQKEEFRIKYTRAFPSWVFYFDLDLLDPDSASAREYLEAKVSQLGGVRYVHYVSSEHSDLYLTQLAHRRLLLQ
jgi:hypothetical protein